MGARRTLRIDEPKSKPGLAETRIEELDTLLQQAEADRRLLERTNRWLQAAGAAATIAIFGTPFLLFFRGCDTSSLAGASDFSQFYSGWVTVAGACLGWGYFLHRFDRRRRRDWSLKRLTECRAFIQVIDSHLVAKRFSPHWEVPPRPEGVGGAPAITLGDGSDPQTEEADADRVYQLPTLAIQYLDLASQEVRLCARIAAMYAQLLSDEADVVVAAESLMTLALEIERNSLLKANLIRQSIGPRGDLVSVRTLP